MREPCASCEASVAIRLVEFERTKSCAECPAGFEPARFSRLRSALESGRAIRVFSCTRLTVEAEAVASEA